MCIKIQRYYMCRARDGRLIDTEQEIKEKGSEAHWPGLSMHPCSTPLTVPEIDNRNPSPADVLPCHGTEDAREEWYLFPCPACQGMAPYLLDGSPDRVVHHPFSTDPVDWMGFKPRKTPERETMNNAIQGYAESLAKSTYCWIDVHWRSPPSDPLHQDYKAPILNLSKQMVSTCLDMVCVQDPQHGFRVKRVFPDEDEEDDDGNDGPNGCNCTLNWDIYQHNPAMYMRWRMNDQTINAHQNVLLLTGYETAQETGYFRYDLRPHWKRVPMAAMAQNPFFEFIPAVEEPDLAQGQSLRRDTDADGPLFGLEAGVRIAQLRCEKRLKDWGVYGDKRPVEVLRYHKPLSPREVAERIDQFRPIIRSAVHWHADWHSRTMPAMLFIEPILEHVAEILAHDSGLTLYRALRILHWFINRLNEVEAFNLPDPGVRGVDGIQRPSFEPPYVDLLFWFIFRNMNIFDLRHYQEGFKLRLRTPYDIAMALPWPGWLEPESYQQRTERFQDFKDDFWRRENLMVNKARYIDDLSVKYIPGKKTHGCTLCHRLIKWDHPGAQICATCKEKTGYEGTLADFGDVNFERKPEQGAGPMRDWDCRLCYRRFDIDNPDAQLPIEWPAETIRCHGKHGTMVVGSACLKSFLQGVGDQWDKRPMCPLCFQALCCCDEQVLRNPGVGLGFDSFSKDLWYQYTGQGGSDLYHIGQVQVGG